MYKLGTCSMRNSIHSSLSARESVREMALFRLLLVASLLFSHLMICMNAVPVTRTESLMHGYQVHQLPEKTYLVPADQKNFDGRMIEELNDYPGSGANNRHTPKAQLGRSGCADC